MPRRCVARLYSGRATTISRCVLGVLAGDTAGNLTPLGVFASEPTKILMTRAQLSTVTSIASLAIENAFYTASVLVVLCGTWLFLQRADVAGLDNLGGDSRDDRDCGGDRRVGRADARPSYRDSRRWSPSWPVVPMRLPTRSGGRVAHLRRPAMARKSHPARGRVGCVVSLPRRLRSLAGIAAAPGERHHHRRRVPHGSGRFVTVAFKFVPYRLGIDEAGSGAVSQVLGLGPTTGVTIALVRRLRIMVLNAIGVFKAVQGH